MKLIKQTFEKVYPHVTTDIGIDLGTANTLVYVRGKGIVLNEPSVVAINKKTGQVVAVGRPAKEMLGRTPEHISAVRPLVEGVIADFEVTSHLMSYLISRARQMVSGKYIAPRVVVGVPSGTTNVERRAVIEATKNAGARVVYLVEEPVASAIGMKLPVHDPIGTMVVDIGGGTSDIAILSLGGLVTSHNLKMGGDHFDESIVSYVRNEFTLLIGQKTAEHLKINAGYLIEPSKSVELVVKGRDIVTGLPREVVVTDKDIRTALAPVVEELVRTIKSVLEVTPPEVISDVLELGIHLVGGGSLLKGLDTYLENTLGIPVFIAQDPLSAVARGAGAILEDMDRYGQFVLIESDSKLK